MKRQITTPLVNQKTVEIIKAESEHYNIELRLSSNNCILEILPKSEKPEKITLLKSVTVDEFQPEDYL